MRRTLTTLFLLVLAACGGGGGAGGSDRPATIELSDVSHEVTEGAVVNIRVVRSGNSSGVASVDYATVNGSAEAGTDFPETSGTLTYADGVSGIQTISIPITADGTAELAETFTLSLSNVSGATLGVNSSATVNIVNASATLPITDGNAQDITVAVLEAVTSTVEVIDIFYIIGLPVTASANSGLADSAVMSVSSGIVDCDTGQATVTWNDADDNFVISTGDTFDVVFDACYFADIDTMFSGPMSLTNLVVTGDPFNQVAPWGLSLTIGFDNLIGVVGVDGAIDGDLDIALNSDDNVVVDLSLSTAALTASGFFDSETLSDFVLAETLDLNALTQMINATGTFASTLLDGAIDFETLQDFMVMGDDNPSSGQLLISDSSSSVLLTVLDNINVQLELDIDLDGIIDQTIVVTWSELDID